MCDGYGSTSKTITESEKWRAKERGREGEREKSRQLLFNFLSSLKKTYAKRYLLLLFQVSTFFDAFVAADVFEHHAEMGYEVKGETSLNTPGFVNMTFRQPIGPVAAIIPWNIPTLSFAMKIAPALTAGCTIVLKTSEKAPLTVWLMMLACFL